MTVFRINFAPPTVRLLGRLDRSFSDLFDRVATGTPFESPGLSEYPAFDIWEDGDTMYAQAEVPGIKMDDLEVRVLGNELSIKGERKDDGQDKVTYHRQERGDGAFDRTLQLPVDVDAQKVRARLRDGVLTITLPKAQSVLPRKIDVKGD